MAKVEFSCVCDDIRFEKGKKISLMGIYGDSILVRSFPHVFPKLGFYQRIVELTSEQKLSVTFRGEGGMKKIKVDARLEPDHDIKNVRASSSANITFSYNGITIKQPGKLIFETHFEGAKEPFRFEVSVGLAKPEDLE